MKDELKIIPLGDAVAKMKTGSTPPTSHAGYFGGDIPWFTPGDIGSTKNLVESTRTLTQEAISEGEAKLFEKGMLLVTCIGDIGRVGILQQPSYSNQQITALKFKDDIDSDFAYYWFVSNKKKLVNLANQAIVPILNNERLSEIEFAYPPLTEQKRIASLLTRADRLRQLRRTAHDLGDALLQSVFLEMFGDVRFPEIPLSELCSFITKGTTPQSSDINDYASEVDDVPFLKVYHLTNNGKVDFDYSPTWVSNSIHNGLLNRSKVYPNDVLMNIVGPPLGKFGIVPASYPEWNVNQAIAIFRAKKQILPIYLLHALRYPKTLEKMISQAVGVRQLNLSLEQCRDFRIPVPPLSLQEEFAGVVARVESLRGRMGESTRQVEGLFESLLAEAFS